MKDDQDLLKVLRNIQTNPKSSQRAMAKNTGFSLGKLNYCMQALKEKGLIKIKNFKNNKSKLNYLYVITPKGISEKTQMTVRFMKLKMREYDELKKEYDKQKGKK